MKQPKVQIPDPAPPVFVPTGPRYRYFSEPPSVVTLRVGDLLPEVPDAVRVLGCDESHTLELSAQEIFQGAVPKISVSRLVELAPDCFRTAGQPDLQIRLPAARLALSYRPVEGKELIEDVPPPFVPPPPPPEALFAPPIEEAAVIEPEPAKLTEEKPPEEKKDLKLEEPPAAEISTIVDALLAEQNTSPLPAPVMAAPDSPEIIAPVVSESPVEFTPPPAPAPQVAEEKITPQVAEEKTTPQVVEEKPMPFTPPVVAEEKVLPSPPAPAPQPRGNIFSMLPIFRRKAPEPAPEPEKPKRARAELPPPRMGVQDALRALDAPTEAPASSGLAAMPPPPPVILEPEKIEEQVFAEPASFAPPISTPVEIMPVEEAPVLLTPEPIVSSALLVETEHLPKETPREAEGEIPDHDGLQALFLTEEFLTVDRVVELCGGLPGINSCVLSHSATVIASHNVPDSIDLVSLSAHALDMLRAMRESSAKMGIGAVPAVTIHSEKGPITFFNQDDLCLLVLHKDKGFVPGVREKLQSVVSELTKARMTKTLGSAPQRTIKG